MLEKGIHPPLHSAHRHVSPDPAHRIRRLVLPLLLALFLSPTFLRAEGSGDAGQIARETDIRTDPSSLSRSLGRLPKGTIVTLTGERKDRFYKVEVELEDGVVSGWVAENSLSKASRGDEPTPTPEERDREGPGEAPEKVRPSSRLSVPKDEGLLLRREQTFFYGVHIIPNLTVIETEVDPDPYFGFGYTVGGHVGMFFGPSLTAQVELAYNMSQGTNPTNGTVLQFGFFDVNGTVRYFIEQFELVGGLQFSMGISLNDVPAALSLPDGAATLSSLYGLVGAGYRFRASEVLNLSLRIHYAVSFLRAPVAIQRIGGAIYMELGG